MIRTFAFTLLLVPLIFVIFGCGGELPQGAVAQVGTSVVSQDQFDKLEAAYQATGHVPDKKTQAKEYRIFQQSLAQYMVMLEVLRQQAPQYGVTITDQAVQVQVGDIKDMFQGDQKRFEAALKTEKLTLAQFTESVRERLLIDKMKSAVTKDVTVSEAEVKAYYDAHKSDYTNPESRVARHILVRPGPKQVAGEAPVVPSEADWEQAKGEADKVRSEILNGTDFAKEARAVSDDEDTKDGGGNLGNVVRGEVVPEFEDAIFSLRKGEISQPVRAYDGYHIFQVTDITPETQMPFEDVKEKILSALLASRQTATWDAWVNATEKKLGVAYASGFAPSSKATTTSTMIPLSATTTDSIGTTTTTKGS